MPWTAGAIACLFVAAVAGVAVARMGYPFDLEWIEGAMVEEVDRVRRGASLYPAPSIDYVPYFYPPLYFWVSAGVSEILGPGRMPLRLVSLLSACGVLALLYFWVRREGGSRAGGLVAAGLFAATYPSTHSWLDLARVDSLFLLLLVLGLYLLRFRPSTGEAIGAGIVLALAALTKQTAIPVAASVLCSLLFVTPRRSLAAAASLSITVGVAGTVLHLTSEGWSTFYLWTVPRSHGMDLSRSHMLWPLSIGAGFWVPILLSAWLLWRWRRERERVLFYGALIGGLVATTLIGRLHPGGAVNTFLPAYLGFALAAGLAVGCASLGAGRLERWAWILVVAQLAVMVYDPRDLVPGRDLRARAERFVLALQEMQGDVLLPWHGNVPGAVVSSHPGAVDDVLRSEGPGGRLLLESVSTAFAERRYSAVVLDRPWFERLLLRYYEPEGVLSENTSPSTLVGMRIRPLRVYRPRLEAAAEAAGDSGEVPQSQSVNTLSTIERLR